MRFHKAVEITGPEAAYLIASNSGAAGRPAVVSFEGTWYDVRSLSANELESFINQLGRRRHRGTPTSMN